MNGDHGWDKGMNVRACGGLLLNLKTSSGRRRRGIRLPDHLGDRGVGRAKINAYDPGRGLGQIWEVGVRCNDIQ